MPYISAMRESEIENYFVWAVERAGGKTYKFRSVSQRGVSDRLACMPDGSTWFVELKTPKGRLSELQKVFRYDVLRLKQNYICISSKEMVDEWIKAAPVPGRSS